MDRYLIIGRTPPPVGGVTTFVLRKAEHLKQSGNLVDLFPANGVAGLLNIVLRKYDCYQVNTMNIIVIFFLFITGNISRVELIDHNHSRHFRGNLKSRLLLLVINRCKKVFIVGEHLRANYPLDFNNLEVVSPFLPPTSIEQGRAELETPLKVKEFISRMERVIVVSAWRYIKEAGIDLYGIESAIDCFKSLDYGDVGLVLCIGDGQFNRKYIEQLVAEFSGQQNMILWEGCHSSWVLFSEKAVYLRPTSTDGNSISIHEALYYKALVLASDVVERPKNCFLYKYGDPNDMKVQLMKLLEKNE